MSVKVWRHGPVGPKEEVLGSQMGVFLEDSAYVVLRTEAPQLLSVWAGEDAAIASKGSAASHAAELLTDLEDHVTIGKEAQGSESADFLSLFPSISYGTPAATEGPAESLEEASDEADEPEDVPGAPAAATASKKKKKKKNKNKGGNGGAPPAAPEPVQEAAAIETEALDAEFELEEAVALPVLPSSPVKAEEPVAEEPEPAPQPEVTAPSPVPAAASPTAAASSARSPAEAAQTPAKSPTPTKAATPLARTPTPAAASPARKPAASPASAAAPAASPVATKSYLADSAKAWGGATAVPAVGVQGKVDRVIPYEELKAMRADSGIVMTSKESYLSDEEFVKVFKKDRAAFLAQPAWRQQQQKKDVGLW